MLSLEWADEFVRWNVSSVSFKCSLAANCVFWTTSFLGLYVDHLVATRQSPWLLQYKLQPDQNVIVGEDRMDLIRLALFNMVFVALFICCPVYEWIWDRMQSENRLTDSDDWRSIWPTEILVKIPVHALVTEIGFFSFHKLLHSSHFCYRHIHKVHHRFQAPTAMACVYAHPIEFALGNLLPIYLGPMVFTNAHPITCYIWWSLAMLGTCKGHCGYRILGHADYHEEHHKFYKYNYGGMSLLDYLFGTMADPVATRKISTK